MKTNVNTCINTKENEGSKCCGKCNKIVKDESKAVVCGFTLNVKVLLMKFINVGGDQVHWYCRNCNNK